MTDGNTPVGSLRSGPCSIAISLPRPKQWASHVCRSTQSAKVKAALGRSNSRSTKSRDHPSSGKSVTIRNAAARRVHDEDRREIPEPSLPPSADIGPGGQSVGQAAQFLRLRLPTVPLPLGEAVELQHDLDLGGQQQRLDL